MYSRGSPGVSEAGLKHDWNGVIEPYPDCTLKPGCSSIAPESVLSNS